MALRPMQLMGNLRFAGQYRVKGGEGLQVEIFLGYEGQ